MAKPLTLFEKSFSYIPSDNPRYILYDFYFAAGYLFGVTTQDDVETYQLTQITDTIVKAAAKHMLYALFIACTEELGNVPFDSRAHPKKIQTVSPDGVKIYALYKSKGHLMTVDTLLQKTAWDPPRLMKAIKEVFTKFRWSKDYGGQAWGAIADTWLKIYSAQTTAQKIIWIDHAYDIQHNTGSVFNKLETYYSNDSLNWLKHALDWKKKNYSITEFYDLVSPSLRPTVAWVAKNIHDITIEQHIQTKKAEISQLAQGNVRLEDFLQSPRGRTYIEEGGKISWKGFTIYSSTYVHSPQGPVPCTLLAIAASTVSAWALIQLDPTVDSNFSLDEDKSSILNIPIDQYIDPIYLQPDQPSIRSIPAKSLTTSSSAPDGFIPLRNGDVFTHKTRGKLTVQTVYLSYIVTDDYDLFYHTSDRPDKSIISVE